jgi:serine phosphatase RsbU (regulator of sigma subunit)
MRKTSKLSHLLDLYKSFPGVLVKIKINIDFSEECLFISENCEQFFGFADKELINNWELFLKTIDVENKNHFKKNILKGLVSNEQVIVDGYLTKPDGEIKWFQLTCKIEDKKTHYLLQGVYVDITTEKNKEIKDQKLKDALLKLSRNPIIQTGKVSDIPTFCVNIISETLNVSRSSFWIFNEDEEILFCDKLLLAQKVEFEDLNRENQNKLLRRIDFPTYFEAMLNEPYIIANDALSHEYTSCFKDTYLIPNKIYSLLDVPIFHKGKVIGVLCQEETNKYRNWEASEVSFLFQISEFISYGFSIHERNLFEEEMEFMNQNLQQLIEKKTEEIETKNKDILDSIRYAERIQKTILPEESEYKSFFTDSFVLYKPKDIVAGDFYWCMNTPEEMLFAVCDCTGHGIPGAFLSIISYKILKRVVEKFELREPGEILDKVNESFNDHFRKELNTIKDGMEIGLVSVKKNEDNTSIVKYSGANISLYYASPDEDFKLKKVKATKQSICFSETKLKHEQFEIILPKNAMVYLFTDGIFDQFGGESGKKIKRNKIVETIQKNIKETCDNQSKLIFDEFNSWKGDLEQLDDICVAGLKL